MYLNLNTFKVKLRTINNLKNIEKLTNATNNFRHLARLSLRVHPFEVY